MSAESPKRIARGVPAIVPPEPVSDRSIIESVTGFINDVTLTNVPQIDPKEQILWARFETSADVGNPSYGEDWDLESGVPPPLLLILGYGTGIQVWAIPANGEATETLSWRHGIVRTLKLLPSPISSNADDHSNEQNDLFAHKRPMMAICDSSQTGSTGPQFCAMNIVSLRDGDSVKSVKFKTTILEILANHQSIVVTFAEKIAVFDARTLEDRLTITTCHPSPGLSPNPVALGPRWLAYAERKMMSSKRSAGGCDCDGVSSYTATMLNAAKTLSKGLRELGEQVAAGLSGTVGTNVPTSTAMVTTNNGLPEAQQLQPGVITVLDIKHPIKDTSPTTGAPVTLSGSDPIVAHFIAHVDVIAGMAFDASGLLLLTADKRGHDFHVFRIHPHPCGSASAAVHHLYILHRGDTTAKVQDLVFSLDSRWAAVSTARGTTHVFPVTPYGGPATYRTHGSAEVVNRLSRFHRSAGLSADGRSSSPVFHSDNGAVSADPYHNPRLPPFPRPHIIQPLKQLRQPVQLATNTSTAPMPAATNQRQRLSSMSDEAGNVLRVCATFARPRDWLLQPMNSNRDIPALRNQRNAVDSLFIMAGHGSMIQYDLEPKYLSSIPTSKQNDDSPIELHVEAKAQWNLQRRDASIEIQPPLQPENWLLKNRMDTKDKFAYCDAEMSDNDDRWLSQVEIVTSSGPHRRLWMGPQFIFKTYNTPSGAPLQHIDSEAVEIGVNIPANRPARSNPMPMPPVALGRGIVPVLIESGSASSFEQSPRLINQYQEYMGSDEQTIAPTDTQLREDLADAMRESPRDSGISSSNSSTVPRTLYVSVGKVVNPLGTVTTITESPQESIIAANEFSEEYSSGAYIHENCDESMFRPYVAVISGVIDDGSGASGGGKDECVEMPEPIGQKLIVPVIDGTQLIRQNEEKVRLESAAAEKMMQIDQLPSSFCAMPPPPQPQSKKEKKKSAKEKNEMTVEAAYVSSVPSVTEDVSRNTEAKKVGGKSRKSSPDLDEKAHEAVKPGNEAIVKGARPKSMDKGKDIVSSMPAESITTKEEEKEVKSPEAKTADGDSVTVKSKKKFSKISAKFSEPILPVEEIKTRKNSKDNGDKKEQEKAKKIADEIAAEIMISKINQSDDLPSADLQATVAPEEMTIERKPLKKSAKKPEVENSEEMRLDVEMEKPTPVERSSLRESKSKESSVEKDALPLEEISKTKKNRKQRRAEKAAADSAESTSPATTVDQPTADPEPTEFTFNLKGKRLSTPSKDTIDDFGMIEQFEKAHDDDCSKIQDSLLKNPVVTATVSLRKSSVHEKYDFVDADEMKSTKSGAKKKKSSKDSMDVSDLVLTIPIPDDSSDFTFADVLEPTPELDSLSFKSTSEDPMSLINFESPLQETSESASLNDRTTDYDKLSDDVEIGADSDAQFSDCKPFQLVIDETEMYVKTSDSNSSDDNEDSSQSKHSKSEKTLGDNDDHDEELQPLIDSATSHSDSAVEQQPEQMLMKTNDADADDHPLPDELNRGDSQKPLPQHQQQNNNNNNNNNGNNNNKKKFRKKRR